MDPMFVLGFILLLPHLVQLFIPVPKQAPYTSTLILQNFQDFNGFLVDSSFADSCFPLWSYWYPTILSYLKSLFGMSQVIITTFNNVSSSWSTSSLWFKLDFLLTFILGVIRLFAFVMWDYPQKPLLGFNRYNILPQVLF